MTFFHDEVTGQPSEGTPFVSAASLATLNLLWLVACLFVIAILGNLIGPILISGLERRFSSVNVSFAGFKSHEWISAVLYGLKLGELLALGVYLGLGKPHWAYRLLAILTGSLLLSSVHIIGYWLARWTPPLHISLLAYFLSLAVTVVVGLLTGQIASLNHWKLERLAGYSTEKRWDLQFDTRLLFKVMIAVAFSIPIIKAIISISSNQRIAGAHFIEMMLWSLWLVVTITSFMTIQLIVMLVPNARKTMIAFAVLAIVGPTLFQTVAQFILPFKLNWGTTLFAYAVSVGVLLSNTCVFLLLRKMGYQLRKIT